MFKLAQVWKNEDLDRLKSFNYFQGEYIAPERIENIYVQSKYVGQVFVYGNGYKVK